MPATSSAQFWKTKKRRTAPAGKSLKTLIRKEAKKVSEENKDHKICDTVLTQVVPVAGAIQQISNILGGTSAFERVGQLVKPQMIELTYSLYSTVETNVRVILFRWKESSGTAPTPSYLLASVNPFEATNSPLNYTNSISKELFTIVYDRVHSMTNINSGAPNARFNIKLKKLGANLAYHGMATAGGHGQYYIMFISDVVGCTSNYYTRLTYTDA